MIFKDIWKTSHHVSNHRGLAKIPRSSLSLYEFCISLLWPPMCLTTTITGDQRPSFSPTFKALLLCKFKPNTLWTRGFWATLPSGFHYPMKKAMHKSVIRVSGWQHSIWQGTIFLYYKLKIIYKYLNNYWSIFFRSYGFSLTLSVNQHVTLGDQLQLYENSSYVKSSWTRSSWILFITV